MNGDQTTERSRPTQEKIRTADLSEAKVTSPQNIMFPSLSDEMLAKIMNVRHRADATRQAR